ncbi:MAG: hypothetical protein P4L33_20270 [Capsulimonadaceae bacterium]|nr:hypothetical protein [Capsulimonadaceae bacterium]
MRLFKALLLSAAVSSALIPLTLGAARCDAQAAIDFEAMPDGGLIAGPGKNSAAAASVSGEAAHAGTRAGKVAYSFSNNGYIEFQLKDPVIVSQTSDPVDISIWIKGVAKQDFTNVALRFMDAKGNIFQYNAPGLAEKFDGDGWARFQITLNPLKFLGTWGPSADNQLRPPLRFFGFGAERSIAAPSKGVLYVDDINVQPAGSAQVEAIPGIALSANRDILIVRTGESVVFRAAYSSAPPQSGVVRYRWRTHDFDGNLVAETPITTTTSGAPPDPYTVRPTEPGFLFVTCELLDSSGGALSETRSSLVALDSPGQPASTSSQPPFLTGMGAHLERWKPAESLKQIEMMRLTGFQLIRAGEGWGQIQPAEDTWNWDAMDKDVDALKAAHIQLEYCLAYSTKWASTGNTKTKNWHDWNNAPPVTEKYAAFVKAVANRYKPYVHYFEIWNEPDLSFWLGTADQYAELLGASVKAIHEANPSATVMNGGFSEVGYRPTFIEDVLSKTSPKPDVIAYHSHGPLSNLPIARAKVVEAAAKAGLGTTPIWINEAGISSVGGTSVREQAITLAKKVATAQALGDRAYIMYDMIDDGVDPVDWEHHYGIVFHDFSPKPAIASVHTVIDRLYGKAFAAALTAEDDQTIYCYRGGSETTVMLWSSLQGSTSSLLFRSSASSATLTDVMGRTTALKPVGGCYTVPISYEPHYLSLPGKSAAIEPLAHILMAPEATIPEAAATKYEITIRNPLTTRLAGTLTLQSETVKASLTNAKVDVAPGKTQVVQTSLTAAAGSGAIHVLHLTLTPIAGLPTVERSVRLRTAVTLPTLASGENLEARAPLVTLDQKRNLVSLFVATPMESLKFHGPADLGAKVWIWQAPEGIRAHVVVTDDIHCQNEQPGSYWKGDSVQLALAGPSGKMLEWTAALTGSGPRIERSVWPDEMAKVPATEQVQATRVGTLTTYDITLPRSIPEIGRAIQFGCRMSLLVNDNDGAGRKGWLEWTPGIGTTKDPSAFVPVAFRNP